MSRNTEPPASAELSFVSGTSAQPLLYRSVDGVLKAAAARTHPQHAALVVPFQSLRYTVRGIRSRGGAGGARLDRGGHAGRAHRDLGAEWRGVDIDHVRGGTRRPRLVNINPAYRTAELEFALRVVGARALVFAPRFKSSDYAAMLASLIPELASAVPGSLCARRSRSCASAVQLGTGGMPGTLSFHQLIAAGQRSTPMQWREFARTWMRTRCSTFNSPAAPRARRRARP
jgi:fatty-acyl-CoA synthase